MKTIPFLILGTNFQYDEKTNRVVRPLFHSSYYVEYSYDDEDPDCTKKLLNFYAEQCYDYDHSVIVDIEKGNIVAYKRLQDNNCIYVRDHLGLLLFDGDYFSSVEFEPCDLFDNIEGSIL